MSLQILNDLEVSEMEVLPTLLVMLLVGESLHLRQGSCAQWGKLKDIWRSKQVFWRSEYTLLSLDWGTQPKDGKFHYIRALSCFGEYLQQTVRRVEVNWNSMLPPSYNNPLVLWVRSGYAGSILLILFCNGFMCRMLCLYWDLPFSPVNMLRMVT